jgi:hypothetical protein
MKAMWRTVLTCQRNERDATFRKQSPDLPILGYQRNAYVCIDGSNKHRM